MQDSTFDDAFARRRVLVTGGAGFIGSHLVERLVALGADVSTADSGRSIELGNLQAVRERIACHRVDLLADDLRGFIADGRYGLVFHLAGSAQLAASADDPRRDLQGNAAATLNLLEALRECSPHSALVYTSSAYVYEGGGSALIREDGPTVPGSPYGVSKLAAERYVDLYARLHGLKTCIMRLFSVYGPRLRRQVVHDLLVRLRRDPTVLVLRGSGKHMRDSSYVGDVVDALLLAATKAPLRGEAYNVASGEPVAIEALAKMIAKTMGVDPQVSFGESAVSGDVLHWFADTSRLRGLGYAPRTSLAEGLQKTWEWFLAEEAALNSRKKVTT
jgi:UDP-glucose 4-epimerase